MAARGGGCHGKANDSSAACAATAACGSRGCTTQGVCNCGCMLAACERQNAVSTAAQQKPTCARVRSSLRLLLARVRVATFRLRSRMTARWEASRGCAAAAALSLAAFPSAAFAAARSRLLLASRSCGQARFAVTRRPLKVAGGVVAPQRTASTKAVQARVMHRLRKLIHKHHSGAHARWHMLCRGLHNMQMPHSRSYKVCTSGSAIC